MTSFTSTVDSPRRWRDVVLDALPGLYRRGRYSGTSVPDLLGRR
jgi:hypothetical protein